jgi:hypothetical protein
MGKYIKLTSVTVALSFLAGFFLYSSKWWAILFAVPFGMFADQIIPEDKDGNVGLLLFGLGIVVCAVAIHLGQSFGLETYMAFQD